MARPPHMLLFTILALCTPAAVAAQGTPAPGPETALVIERVKTSFVLTPEYKVTELDGDVAHLAGGSAGWLTDNTLFVGGAAHSVANREDGFRLTYGGVVAGWTLFPDRRIQVGARGLAGFGHATLGTDIELRRFGGLGDPSRIFETPTTRSDPPRTIRVRTADDFFVVEPQLAVLTRVTRHVSLHVGAGYRLTAYAERLGDRVNGGVGSVGVQFGGW